VIQIEKFASSHARKLRRISTGADLAFMVAPGVQVFAGAESAFEDDGDSVFSGRVGGALKF
jgi:hypothetical protein